jgi:hypothetical protein
MSVTRKELMLKLKGGLWPSGQSSWLLTQRSGFNSSSYQILCIAVDLERDPVSLIRINEELLERKVAVPV